MFSGDAATTCTSNAPTTSPKKRRARCKLARGGGAVRSCDTRRLRGRVRGLLRRILCDRPRQRRARPHSSRAPGYGLEYLATVGSAEHRFHRVLRMRHQAEHVEALVGDARDRAHRAIWVGGLSLASIRIDIAQNYLPAFLHLAEFIFGRYVESLAVLDREPQKIALLRCAREWRARVLDP